MNNSIEVRKVNNHFGTCIVKAMNEVTMIVHLSFASMHSIQFIKERHGEVHRVFFYVYRPKQDKK